MDFPAFDNAPSRWFLLGRLMEPLMSPFLRVVAQPYGLLFALTGLALLRLWIKRRESRRRLLAPTISFALLYLLSMPITGHFAMASLERAYPPGMAEGGLEKADAIVVLSGYAFPSGGHRPRPELAYDTLYRCVHAVELYRAGGARPVLVTGGSVDPTSSDPSLGEQMRDFLILLGVQESDVITESQSRNTHENAVECGKILRARTYRRIVLVTDAGHMKRAVRCYQREGLEVIPSGCHYRALRFDLSIQSVYPTPSAAMGVLEAMHEWVGLLWYGWNGWT